MIAILKDIKKMGILSSLILVQILFVNQTHAKNLSQSDQSLAKIEKNSVLKICSDAGFLPFEMKTPSGNWTGFDVDMMQDFAKSLNVKLEMMQIGFDGIIPALLAGKCDMIAAGMTVTPERKKVVAFSDTTFENALSIALKNTPQNKKRYTSLESLDHEGITFAVKTGYTSDIYLSKKLTRAKIFRFDQDSDLLLAVTQGRADAFVSDATYVKLTNKTSNGKFLILPTLVSTEKFSVAGRKQDKILMQKFNSFLKKWKADGNYKKAEKRYFENE